jgi:hypothetical protein
MSKPSDLEAALMRNPFFARQIAEQTAKPTKVRRTKPARPLGRLPEPEVGKDFLVFTFPLPHKQLHKNGSKSKNYGWVSSLKRTAKNIAYFATLSVKPREQWQRVRIDLEFWTAKQSDDDGLVGFVVCYRDGIAAGLGLDDKHFTQGEVRQNNDPKRDGERKVQITITRIP